jgi:hypothetical protein
MIRTNRNMSINPGQSAIIDCGTKLVYVGENEIDQESYTCSADEVILTTSAIFEEDGIEHCQFRLIDNNYYMPMSHIVGIT